MPEALVTAVIVLVSEAPVPGLMYEIYVLELMLTHLSDFDNVGETSSVMIVELASNVMSDIFALCVKDVDTVGVSIFRASAAVVNSRRITVERIVVSINNIRFI